MLVRIDPRRRGAFCQCGCGRRCFHTCRYATRQCMPTEERSRLAREAAAKRPGLQRLARFRAYLDRLPQRMTREDLATVLYEVYRRGYHAGRCTGARVREEEV